MADKIIENNQVSIMGKVASGFTFSHQVYGEGFYLVDVLVKRLSDSEDRIPLMVSERLVDVTQDYEGEYIMVQGQFRSYNRHEEKKNRLVLSVFVRDAFWKREYQSRYYVRWTIIDKSANCVIGTIELFNRKAKDYFNNCGLLRLDLRSDYEKQDTIEDILGIIIPETRDMFACEMIATKVVSIAQERIQALEHMGFSLSEESLIGHNGTKYDSYYVREV